mmetsp:Transcript_47027/g.112018  ORF Transcript_47027/g.112018 Transcript_47027/m.112018 type:complete len:210 (-) Transcript_47027:2107-2736(-)
MGRAASRAVRGAHTLLPPQRHLPRNRGRRRVARAPRGALRRRHRRGAGGIRGGPERVDGIAPLENGALRLHPRARGVVRGVLLRTGARDSPRGKPAARADDGLLSGPGVCRRTSGGDHPAFQGRGSAECCEAAAAAGAVAECRVREGGGVPGAAGAGAAGEGGLHGDAARDVPDGVEPPPDPDACARPVLGVAHLDGARWKRHSAATAR